MQDYQWSFEVILKYREALLNGALLTLALTFLSIIFGTFLGAIVARIRKSRFRLLRLLSFVYIELFRSVPLLVLLVWFYYCLPILFGVRFGSFSTAVIAMSMNLSGFVAETIRSGIEAIPKGQKEAGLSLGLTESQVLRRIILPQSIKIMVPNMLGLYITMLKLSSLASVIAVSELLHSSNNIISQSFRPLEVFTAIAMIYVIIIMPLSYYARRLESNIQLG